MKKIKMQDIAESLNISKATVSRALNNRDDISPKMKQAVIEKCNEMGYSINYSAKALATQKNYIIGIITNEVFTEDGEFFYKEIYTQLVKKLDQIGYATTLKIISIEEREKKSIPFFVQNGMIDGIVVIGELSKEYIQMLGNNSIPMVLVDFDIGTNEFDSIVTSNVLSMGTVAEKFISDGYEKIAFVGNTQLTNSIYERYLGYQMEMEKNNLKPIQIIEKKHSDDEPNFDAQSVYDNDVFLCNNDYTAYRLVEFIKSLGFLIPENKRVIGFDNTLYSDISIPKISTIDVRRDLFAQEAINIIISRINTKDRMICNMSLMGKYVEKDS